MQDKRIQFECGSSSYNVDIIALEYGLPMYYKGKGSSHYYRVWNDIFEMNCTHGVIWAPDARCDVYSVERNSFYQ